MTTYILVHGACHAGWCWEKVKPLLEARGHKVLTPDLPACGDNRTPIASATQN
jgi:pimeloyl-ACP methyl ester carboxylesterase